MKHFLVLFVALFFCSAHAASVTRTPLNLRTGPGTEFPIIQTLEAGRTVEVLDSINHDDDWNTPNWNQVLYGETLGYVSSQFLEDKKDWVYNTAFTVKENYYPGATRIGLSISPRVAGQAVLVRVFPVKEAYFEQLDYRQLEFTAAPTRGNRRTVGGQVVPSDRIFQLSDEKISNFLELNDLKSGGYLVTVSNPATPNSIESHSTILVTRLAVFNKSDTEQSQAWVVDSKTAKPLENVQIQWLDQDEKRQTSVVASAITNAQGIAQAKTPDMVNRSFKASLGSDVAFIRDNTGGGVANELQSGTSPASILEREDQRALIVTDRPLYRGGDTVMVQGNVKDLSGATFAPSSKPLLLKLTPMDVSNVVLQEYTVTPDASGQFKLEFKLETDVRDTMQLTAFDAQTGRRAGWASFAVRPYIKPLFSAVLSGASEVVAGGQTFDLKGTYFAGGKINALADVYLGKGFAVYSSGYQSEEQWQTYFNEERYRQSLPTGAYSWDETPQDREGQGKPTRITKGKGQITFDLKILNNQATTYNLEARIRDELGREVIAKHAVDVYPNSIVLEVKADNEILQIGQKTKINLRARKVGSQEVWANQAVSVRLFRNVWRFEKDRWISSIVQSETSKVSTNAQGIATLEYTPKGTGSLWAELGTTDKAGRSASLQERLGWVPAEAQPASRDKEDLYIELDFKDRVHAVGEELAMRVKTNLPDSTNVWFSLEGRKLFSTQLTTIGALKQYKLKVSEELVPGFAVKAVAVQDELDVYSSADEQFVPPAAKKLEVRLTVKNVVSKPGDEVEVAVKTTQNGKPVSSWVLLGAVNDIIYKLQSKTTPDPYLYYWGYSGNKVVSYDSITQSICECGGGGGGEEGGDAAGFRENFNDTALFKAVTTAADGTATLKFKLPDDLADYRLGAYTLGSDAAAGYTERVIQAKLPFYIRLNLPAFLTKGDRSAGFAVIHNLTTKPLQTQVAISADQSISRNVLVPAEDSLEVPFAFNATRVGDLKVSASAKSNLFSDAVKLTVPVREIGSQVELVWQSESAGGTLTDSIEVPTEALSPSLETTVAPSRLGMALGDIEAMKKPEFSRDFESVLNAYWIYRLERVLEYPSAESLRSLQNKVKLLLLGQAYNGVWYNPAYEEDWGASLQNLETLLRVRDVVGNDHILPAIEKGIRFFKQKLSEFRGLQDEVDWLETLLSGGDAGQKPDELEYVAYLLQSNPTKFAAWYATLRNEQQQSSDGLSIDNNLELTAYALLYQTAQGLPEAVSSATWISNVLSGSRYRSPVTGALAKFALANFLNAKGLTATSRNLEIGLAGQVKPLSMVALFGLRLEWALPKERSFAMTYSSPQPFAARRVLRYFTTNKPVVRNEFLQVSRSYSATTVGRNRLLEVRLRVEVKKPQKLLKVVDPFAGGFETFGTVSYGNLYTDANSLWAEAKTLSDKVEFMFTDVAVGNYVLSYKLRSLAAGKYYAASPTLETEGGKVEGVSALLEVTE